MVGHSVLTLLHEFQLTDIRLEQSGKFGVGRFRAFYLEPLLSVLQFAHKAMMMRSMNSDLFLTVFSLSAAS